MIQRVAQRFRNSLRPLLKLFPIGRVARDEALVHTARSHGAPFVMVAVQPDLREIIEAPILCDVFRREMTVIVNDRKRCRIAMIQLLCGLRF